MKFSAENPDIKRFLEQVKTAFNERMKENTAESDASVTEHTLRRAILTALQGGAKNGRGVQETISAVSAGAFVPTESQVFPTLEALAGEGLVSFTLEAEKKVYAITDAGSDWLAANPAVDSGSGASNGDSASGSAGSKHIPKDTFKSKAELVKAGLKLGQAVAAVGGTESVAKHKRAAEIVESASKAVFAILAEDD